MGFLGFGNYAKPGKGVKKNDAEKTRIFQFCELYVRRISRIFKLNLLYVIFCIPSMLVFFGAYHLMETFIKSSPAFSLLVILVEIVSIGFIGPPTAALMKISRCFVDKKPIFLMSDFFQAYKENFKSALLIGLTNSAVAYSIFQAFIFYYAKLLSSSRWFWVPLVLIMIVALILILANFYTYLTLVTVNLNWKGIIKNSFALVFLGIKSNLITLFFVLLIVVPCIIYIAIGTLLFLIIGFSTIGLIVAFNSLQYIYKYCVKPYYAMHGLEDPFETSGNDQVPIFQDTTVVSK